MRNLLALRAVLVVLMVGLLVPIWVSFFLVSDVCASLSNISSGYSSDWNVTDCFASLSADREFPNLQQAREAIKHQEYPRALESLDAFINAYEKRALSQQASLTEYPWESRERINDYKILNAVSVAWLLKAKVLEMSGQNEQAMQAYQRVIKELYFGQCVESTGMAYHKPAELAQQLEAAARSKQ